MATDALLFVALTGLLMAAVMATLGAFILTESGGMVLLKLVDKQAVGQNPKPVWLQLAAARVLTASGIFAVLSAVAYLVIESLDAGGVGGAILSVVIAAVAGAVATFGFAKSAAS